MIGALRRARLRAKATARLAAGRVAGRVRPSSSLDPEAVPRVEPEAGLPFDDGGFESRLVWMMGSPRSGTTWLLRMLIHPWILSSQRPSGAVRPLAARRASLPDIVPLNETFLPMHLAPLRSVVAGPDDDGPPPEDVSIAAGRAGDPAYFFADAFVAAWRPELRRLILARLWSQAELASREHSLRDPLLLIKEPNGSHAAEQLMWLLPRARLLFVVRDGRDVVDSLLDAERSWAPAAGAGSAERLSSVRRHAWLWLRFTSAVQRAYEERPPELRRMVRYEDLRRAPGESLAPLLEWLGLAHDPARVRDAVETNAFESLPGFAKGPGTPRRAAAPGLWRTNLSAPEREAMDEIMSEKLAELGYDGPA